MELLQTSVNGKINPVPKLDLPRTLINILVRGGSRIFLGGGAPLYFNTNKLHFFIFFLFFRIPVVLESRRSSQGDGVRTPCTLLLDPLLLVQTQSIKAVW